jgi:hypothetical protein
VAIGDSTTEGIDDSDGARRLPRRARSWTPKEMSWDIFAQVRAAHVGSPDPAHSDFQDRERSPHDSLHGLYWALTLAHRWHAT